MKGPITARVRLIKTSFRLYHEQIKRLLGDGRNASELSDDADLIGTYNWQALLKPARDDLAAHIARKDNPHQEDIESIGSYKLSTVRAKLTNKIPNAILPISHYGVYDELTEAQITAAWTSAGFVLSCNRVFRGALTGTLYTLPVSQLDLTEIDPSPAGKTFNIYLRSELGFVGYQARTDSPPESDTVMFIGQCVVGASSITSIAMKRVTRIDTFRISETPVGSAIPVTTGTYTTPTKLATAWKP